MSRKLALIIVVAFVAGAVAGLLGVRVLWWDRTGMAGNGSLARHLSLSAQQQERIATINERFFQRVAFLRGEIAANTRQLREELASSNPSREHIQTIVDEINRLRGELHHETVGNMLNIRAELSEKQWERFLALLGRKLPRMFAAPRAGPGPPPRRR